MMKSKDNCATNVVRLHPYDALKKELISLNCSPLRLSLKIMQAVVPVITCVSAHDFLLDSDLCGQVLRSLIRVGETD